MLGGYTKIFYGLEKMLGGYANKFCVWILKKNLGGGGGYAQIFY